MGLTAGNIQQLATNLVVEGTGDKGDEYDGAGRGGQGRKLGTAYRLTTGEVIYVPENATG